jgi:hypothetical protein
MKVHPSLKALFFLIFILNSNLSYAQVFQIKVLDYGGTDSIPALKNIVDTFLQDIEDDANEDIPQGRPDRIMEGISDSSVIAAKGIGQDYASNFNTLLIGAGVGVGADLKKETSLNSPVSGIAAATGVIVGTKLNSLGIQEFANLDASRVYTFLNFMNFAHQEDLVKAEGANAFGRFDILNIGLHFRYDWLDGWGDNLFGWGGVKLHWGYEFNDMEITFESDIDRVISADNGAGNINGRVTGRPKYRVTTQSHSIPLTVSTDIRFLYLLSLYGGGGMDLSYGETKGRGVLNGEVTPLICTSGGFCGGGKLIQVQAQANLNAEGRVNPVFLRTFAGLQLNLPYFRIFGQIDKVIGHKLLAASAGLNFIF